MNEGFQRIDLIELLNNCIKYSFWFIWIIL